MQINHIVKYNSINILDSLAHGSRRATFPRFCYRSQSAGVRQLKLGSNPGHISCQLV